MYGRQIYDSNKEVGLRKDVRDIRLVILSQGAVNDPIKCRLIRARIEREIVYDALSYKWGSPNDRSLISVNGFPFQAIHGLINGFVPPKGYKEMVEVFYGLSETSKFTVEDIPDGLAQAFRQQKQDYPYSSSCTPVPLITGL